MGINIETTEMYNEWFKEQTLKFQAQIVKRLFNIETQGHFGHVKQLDKNLAEIKFNNGARIYFTRLEKNGKTILLILGGNKNGQDKDIKKAKAFFD